VGGLRGAPKSCAKKIRGGFGVLKRIFKPSNALVLFSFGPENRGGKRPIIH